MKAFQPNLEEDLSISMLCDECDFASQLFLITCPSCGSYLKPAILDIFLHFKSLYLNLLETELLEDQLSADFFSDLTEWIDREDFKRMTEFITTYYSHYYSEYLYQLFMYYAERFKGLLRKDYLYRFHRTIREELDFTLKNLHVYGKKRKQDSSFLDTSGFYNNEMVYILLSRVLKKYSEIILSTPKISEEEKVATYIVLSMINDLIKKLRNKLITISSNTGEELTEFKEWVIDFSFHREQYSEVPPVFVKYLESKEIYSILYRFQLELYYLPSHNKHLIVKSSYEPDLKEIEQLNIEKGGLSWYLLKKELGLSSIEAQLIIQVLLRRKLGITTFSYLQGEKF
ncbi:MAG: hypothetical protein GF311_02915, partial [Candidatus Lokiarchaeota archaeon]|nr:hypothetical protein [Candidatus Lokiarchaeota archaeon]